MKRFLRIPAILFFLLTLSYLLNSAELRRIDIKPLNRASLYFTNITSFTSSLSQDKQRVILNIRDCKALDVAKQKSSSGIIRDVFSKQNGEDLEISISLNGKRGYTCVALPYSQSIIVDIFSWDKLSPGEEKYRQSLLGWKDKTLSVEDLKQSAKENIMGANAMLGLYFMREGRPSKAVEFLLKAEINKTNISDVFAALSQIYSLKNISNTAEKYANKFSEITSLTGFPELPSLDDPSEIILPEKVFAQSEDKSSSTSSPSSDTIVIKDTEISDNEKLDILEEYSEIIFYSLLVLLLIFLILFFTFKSLQRSGDKDAEKMISSRFAEEVRQAKKASDDKIRNLKNMRGDDSEAKDKEKTEKQNILTKKYNQEAQEENKKKKEERDKKKKNLKNQSEKVPQIKKVLIKKQENVKEKDNSKDIENFLENYIPIKRNQEKEEIEKAKDELLLDSDVSNERQTNSPDVNLALHLANEKQKIKQKHISDLDEEGSLDKKALERKAKESGLETGSVETKNLIIKLEKDQDKLSKLSGKFSPNPSEDKKEE
jgi:hypothetical protein